MPTFYHIHRGTKVENLNKKFRKGYPLFFSTKNSFWYNIEREISKDYGGYVIYKIYIPSSFFSYSFKPRSRNKIVKVTDDNLDKYKELKINTKGHLGFIKAMKKRNIIGIEANYCSDKDYCREGYIWQKPRNIKISCVKVVKL